VVAEGTSGLLVPPGQPAALARASCELLADPARAQSLARAGQARMRAHYTLDQMIDATAALYGTVVAGRRGQAPESLPTLAEHSVGE
jgi:starch synthase